MTKFVPGGPPRYAHQRRGLRKIIKNRGVAALLFDPGTGKTATALDYASILALKSPPERREARVLVICPLAACDTWVIQSTEYVADGISIWAEVLGGSMEHRAEALAARGGKPFRRPLAPKTKRSRQLKGTQPRALHASKSWAWNYRATRPLSRAEGPDGLGDDHPKLILEVMNFDTFASRREIGSRTMADIMVRAVERFDPDLVVVDESHKIKGVGSNVSRLLSRIGDRVPRRIILTGTVMPHSPLDVFAQWRFLAPTDFGEEVNGTRLTATFSDFKERYAELGGFMGKEIKGFKNLDEMQEIMAKKAIVARKEDALDLPKTTDVIVPVHLNSAEKKAYLEMKRTLATSIGAGMVMAASRLTQMMRLRQITSGVLPDHKGNLVDLGNSKVQTIASLVNDTLAGEERIVIFCEFTQEIEMIRQALSTNKQRRVRVIRGGVKSDERRAIREEFGGPSKGQIVLVAQISTLSLAVNELVTASHAIFGSLSQRRDDFVQARDRLNRVGQTRPVTYWYALSPGTVDEVIWNSIQKRTNLEKAMLDHIYDGEVPEELLGGAA